MDPGFVPRARTSGIAQLLQGILPDEGHQLFAVPAERESISQHPRLIDEKEETDGTHKGVEHETSNVLPT